MFKRIQKIDRKKRLVFLFILSFILAVVCLSFSYETILSLPSDQFLFIGFSVFFVCQMSDLFFALIEELKNNRISSENSD